MTTVSVIIPVYKVADYLAKCLDSVIHQTFKDIEIICVNDCSSDHSLAILNDYAQKDKRIQIINFPQNRGVSMARNAGIEVASGQYIYFMDSDDWLELNFLEEMVKAAQESGCDIVVNTTIQHVEKDKTFFHQRPYKGQLTDKQFWDTKNAMSEIFCVVWNKLYVKSFIDKYALTFPEHLIHEDFYFQYICFANTDRFYTIDGPVYYYLNRPGSFMNTLVDDDLKMLKVYHYIFDYLQSKDLLHSRVKLFYMMPFFKVSDENRFLQFKSYFEKIRPYFEENKDLYNDIEVFFANNMLTTPSFEEYKSKFPASVAISYIRRKK